MKKYRIQVIIAIMAMITQSTWLIAQSTGWPKLSGIELGYFKTDIEYVKCNLNEPFSPDQLAYTATVDQMNTASVFVTPYLPGSIGRQIKINGIFARSGERFKLDMKPGANQVEISVSDADGITGVYKLNINQADLSAVYVAELIAEGVWRIADFGGFPGGENMYLVEGKEKALLFDTGMGKGDLAAYVRSLTKLPVEIAITHAHRDHIGQNDQFKGSTVYMDQDDLYRVPKEMITSKYKFVKEGDVLDLGSRRFEVIELPGHSLGHLIFLDRENKLAVVGDIIGSGDRVHMQGSNRTTMEIYLQGLRKFEGMIRGMNGLTLLTGHFYQEKVPLVGVAGMQLPTDMRILAEKILSGAVVGELTFSTRDDVTTVFRKAYYGLAGMYYNPDLNLPLGQARMNESKPELSGLELGFNKTEIEYVACKLNEPFAPDQFAYSALVEKSRAARMFLTAFLPESGKEDKIRVNGALVRAGEKYGFDVQPEQPVQLTVTSPEGKTSIYSLAITPKDLSAEYIAEVVSAGVWRIHDYGGFPGNENMYLVEGKDKAMLFDAGLGTGDLAGFVKKLTPKPIDLAITHGHGDHTKQIGQFSGSVVYMSENDKGMLPKDLNTDNFKWVKKGDKLDLGGRSFEVLELPTHSKGSLVFLDETGKIAVVGDAVGSGTMVWAFMVPFKDLTIYTDALRVIEERIKPINGLTLLVGHHYQEKVPLTGVNGKQLFTDMRLLTEKVLQGEIMGDIAYTTRNGKITGFRRAYYGLAGLWYNAQ